MKKNNRLFLQLLILFLLSSSLIASFYYSKGSTQGQSINPGLPDKTPPSIVIISPTGLSSYSTKSTTINLTGIAYDDRRLVRITWSNDQGGSGNATWSIEWSISDIQLQQGDNVITVTAKDLAGNSSNDSITVTYNPYLEFLSTLQAIPDAIFVNEETGILFRIAIEDNPNLDRTSVRLISVDENNNIIETLTTIADDGNVDNGDDIEFDGVFSGKAILIKSEEGLIRLRITADTIEAIGIITAYSEIFKLSVITHLTDEEFFRAVNMPNEAKQTYNELKITYGKEEARKKTVEWLKAQPEIAEAGTEESGEGIWYVLDSGILGGILLQPKGTKGERYNYISKKLLFRPPLNYKSLTEGSLKYKPLKSYSANASGLKIGSNNVIVISPFANQGGEKLELSKAVESYDNVFDTFYNSSCPIFNVERIKDTKATSELFKTLNKYGVVVLDTHGSAFWNINLLIRFYWLPAIFEIPRSKVVFLTGEKPTKKNKSTYEVDIKKARLAIINDYYAVTPAFITYYNKNFPQSLIYSGACQSIFNDSMASAFIGNGAKSYFGHTDTVHVSYDNGIVQTLFNSLVKEEKTTGEALITAVEKHGPFDEEPPHAHFKMFGSSKLRVNISGIINGAFEEGNINGWIVEGDVRIISKLGPLSPTEGIYMNIISTGLGAIYDSNSYIKQTFCIPAGINILSFDYNVVSEEPMEWVGTIYDDRLEISLESTSGKVTIVYESVNTSSWIKVDGINFYGGDYTTYMTDWKHIIYDVSGLAGDGPVTLKFHTWDRGDSIYDTVVLIDNIKLK